MILLERSIHDGSQTIYKFDNGYGASVVFHSGSYGSDQGLKELAVIKFREDDKWHLCYETEITDDVLGYLTDEDVVDLLVQIESLEVTK